jgi:hypothetical protein
MKRYINAKQNLVMFSPPKGQTFDCSAFLAKGMVLIAEDENGFWYETEPFTGQIRNITNMQEIDAAFKEAEKSFYDAQLHVSQSEVDLQILELRNLLDRSDYKVLPDYDKPNDEIKAQRKVWREKLRKLIG